MTVYSVLQWWQSTLFYIGYSLLLSYIDDSLLYLSLVIAFYNQALLTAYSILVTAYSFLHLWQPTLSYIGDSLLHFTLVTAYSILHWLQPTLSYIGDSLL
jgi:hypothetical protein